MRAPEFSEARFLGPDESLVARIAGDLAVLESLATSPDQVADRLQTVVDRQHRAVDLWWRHQPLPPGVVEGGTRGSRLRRFFGWPLFSKRTGDIVPNEASATPTPAAIPEPAVSDERFDVRLWISCGEQECPFHREGRMCGASGVNFTIHNRLTGGTLSGSLLIVHLIRAHRFFEGVGLEYRLDPAHAVEVLELKPGEDYAPEFDEEWVWPFTGWSEGLSLDVSQFPWPKEEPEPGIEIYRQLNGGCVVRVAKGCRRRALEFDGAVMEFMGAGIHTFERKRITRFVR